MRGVAFFSGGKDGLYAVYLAENMGIRVDQLLILKTSIGVSPHWENVDAIRKIAMSMNRSLLFFDMAKGTEALAHFVSKLGVDYVIAGDVHLEDHKIWVENLAKDANVKALEPLWGRDSEELAREMLEVGLKWAIIAVDKEKLPRDALGYTFESQEDLDNFLALYDVDPLGEYGEFHTVVLESPLFEMNFSLRIVDIKESGRYYWVKFDLREKSL
ncbi:hypothetical protein PNA2_0144 [Pyrococcus sp. NA2]|uniref:PAB0415 family putative ATP pyrophosphatase n=1 Tax=Pyrococcus sp. (strain NA2) TaxID=342949 RepID=UPI000209AEC1|nr:ATP pyrophosphatase [Pyrococcus sp. NA2]AEC51062.1 hypothetical protein PNA2_0144 [Pyrococcus sp. NA2]